MTWNLRVFEFILMSVKWKILLEAGLHFPQAIYIKLLTTYEARLASASCGQPFVVSPFVYFCG